MFFVPGTRFELAHRNRRHPLKVVCLPIPPSGHFSKIRTAKIQLFLETTKFSTLILVDMSIIVVSCVAPAGLAPLISYLLSLI